MLVLKVRSNVWGAMGTLDRNSPRLCVLRRSRRVIPSRLRPKARATPRVDAVTGARSKIRPVPGAHDGEFRRFLTTWGGILSAILGSRRYPPKSKTRHMRASPDVASCDFGNCDRGIFRDRHFRPIPDFPKTENFDNVLPDWQD